MSAFRAEPEPGKLCRIGLDDNAFLVLERIEAAGGEGGWHLRRPGETRRVSVIEAALLAGELADSILRWTETELLRCDERGSWKSSIASPHPSSDPRVQRLYAEWVAFWTQLSAREEQREPERIEASAFESFLESERGLMPSSVHVLVVGHDAVPHEQTIATALRELIGVWDCDAAAIFAGERRRGYVQVLVHPAKETAYGEAADLDAQGLGHLSAERVRLERLGWHDPKIEAMPYQNAEYGVEWQSNFVREWRLLDVGAKAIARELAATLHAVYVDEADEDLEVRLIPYDDRGGGEDIVAPVPSEALRRLSRASALGETFNSRAPRAIPPTDPPRVSRNRVSS